MGSNKTVGFTALAYINATSPYGDGKPAVLMDFSQLEDRLVRPFVDEVRRWRGSGVGASAKRRARPRPFPPPPLLVSLQMRYINDGIWLGQSYVYNEWSVQAKEGKGKGDKLNQGAVAAVASTLTDILQWAGVSKTGNDNVPSAQGFYLMGYFALQCVGPKTPKLRYSALAYYDALQGVKRHFLPADYQLPALPTTADEGAVAGPGFPAASESASGDFPKLHMWPYRRSDVRLGANITQMKPFKGEFIHGERALYPIAAQGMQDWRDANRSYLGWVPTDAQRAAIKGIESHKLLALAEAFDAKAQYAGEAFPVYPGAPTDDTTPYLAPPVTEWAVHAIVAANEAVKAASDNGIKGNPVAQLISEIKYRGQLKISVVADAASVAYSAIVGPKDLQPFNATFVDGLKEIKKTLSLNRSAVSLKPQTEIRAALDVKALINATKNLPPYTPNITAVPFNLTRFKSEIKNAATPEKLAVKTNADNRPVQASRLGLAPPGPLFG